MKILQPIEIKSMKLKNRIAFAPFFNMPAGEDGFVNDLTIRWFEERAKGGAGFLMTGGLGVSPLPEAVKKVVRELTTPLTRGLFGLSEDKYTPGYAKLTAAVHSYGAKIGAQLCIPMIGPAGGLVPSPPPYPSEKHPFEEPTEILDESLSLRRFQIKALSIEEIEQFNRDFATAAARAKEAGFDCVELHSCHVSTIHGAFLSPYYNRRTDKYGGDWESRTRLTSETIRAMRGAVGEDFPIIVRINAEEFIGKWGITIEDTCKFIVPAMEECGADCISVSQGHLYQTPDHIFLPLYFPRGAVIYLAEAVKKVTSLPVIGVGKIVDMGMAERFLDEGKADIIYMGRQLTADPETPRKYFEGRPEDIRKCIGDQKWSIESGLCGRPCVVNYDLQDEPIPLKPAEKRKKVLIIGGGVGGMEAARVARLRGHEVTLMEREGELGGMVAALALNPLMAGFRNIVDYLTVQMRKLDIDVKVCKEAKGATVEELKPDVVILATGSSMELPEITEGKPGVMTLIEALKRKEEVGQRVVIWGFPGAELAIPLAEEGKEVILMGGGEASLAAEVTFPRRTWLFRKLTDYNFIRVRPELRKLDNPKVLYNAEVKDITQEGIKLADNDRWGERILSYDTLIISRGRRSNDSLFNELKGKAPEVHKIGDCLRVRDIKGAIWSANEIARMI